MNFKIEFLMAFSNLLKVLIVFMLVQDCRVSWLFTDFVFSFSKTFIRLKSNKLPNTFMSELMFT